MIFDTDIQTIDIHLNVVIDVQFNPYQPSNPTPTFMDVLWQYIPCWSNIFWSKRLQKKGFIAFNLWIILPCIMYCICYAKKQEEKNNFIVLLLFGYFLAEKIYWAGEGTKFNTVSSQGKATREANSIFLFFILIIYCQLLISNKNKRGKKWDIIGLFLPAIILDFLVQCFCHIIC